jgi:hypothetical protein
MAGLTLVAAMPIREPLDHELYEYKKVPVQPTRYNANESLMTDHRFKYTKRRMWIRQSKWTGYRPECSCKWKSVKWWPNKDLANSEHLTHAKEYVVPNPRFEGL